MTNDNNTNTELEHKSHVELLERTEGAVELAVDKDVITFISDADERRHGLHLTLEAAQDLVEELEEVVQDE